MPVQHKSGGRVYHWKHGWIPLDHAAAVSKYGKSGAESRGFASVSHDSLPRKAHIVATFDDQAQMFSLHDTQTGNRVSLGVQKVNDLQRQGKVVKGVQSGGRLAIEPPKPGEPAFLKKFGRIEHPSHQDAIRNTNPDFDRSKIETTINCARVVQAYELRRRGYDVQARHGSAELAYHQSAHIWVNKDTGRTTKIRSASSQADFEAKIKDDPAGARYFVALSWSDHFGRHILNAEKQPDGSIRLIDAQVGDSRANRYFDMALDGVNFFRVDDTQPKVTANRHLEKGRSR